MKRTSFCHRLPNQSIGSKHEGINTIEKATSSSLSKKQIEINSDRFALKYRQNSMPAGGIPETKCSEFKGYDERPCEERIRE